MNESKDILVVLVSSLLLVVIVTVVAPQETLAKEMISSILIFVWIFTIFLIGIPRHRLGLNYVISKKKWGVFYLFLIYVLLPYVLLLPSGAITGILAWLLWYVLPFIIFSIPEMAKNKELLQKRWVVPVINIVGALLLWIGFDHRYTDIIFENYEEGYLLNSLWMAAVGFVSFGRSIGMQYHRNFFDQVLVPNKPGIKYANIATPLASLIIVPFGLLTGFLLWNPVFDALEIIIGFLGIYLTIALQEEMIFRGIILNQSDQLAGENDRLLMLSLILVSFVFGLTHWNNETSEYFPHYLFSATVAGIAYGWCYRKGGMFAAILSHTLVDWVWAIFLKRA